MIVGTGIDITLISRMESNVDNTAFMNKVFTRTEQEYIQTKANRAQTAAGLFCAKEACMKALGKGITDMAFLEIEILHSEGGAPYIRLDTEKKLHLSISHMGDYAVAQVIVEE